jgi:NAD(P)-dependent dehydrogenase (short-subunit alcohol dehydrogenase family)
VPVGRTALVTGAGTGIGAAVAEALAADGTAVVLAGRRRAPLEEIAARVDDAGGRALAVEVDITADGDAERAVAAAVDAFGALHIVVNNAGAICRGRRLHELSMADWDAQLDVNLRGHVRVVRAALPRLLDATGDRCIVNVGSTLSHKLVAGVAPYATAKGALISLTRALAVEYGEEGIRANAVLPAIVRTALAHTDRPTFDADQTRLAAAYPLGRLGEPADVGEVVAWVASPRAAWMTGVAVDVDGGVSAT